MTKRATKSALHTEAPRKMTDLERAQDIMWDAFDTPSRKKRIALSHQALAISDKCADAWVMLAQEEAASPETRLEFYLNALRVGERALGKKAFKENIGHFWGILETRPYMRAMQGLAGELNAQGELGGAAGIYNEMLRLNPGDNQGARYELLNVLLAMGGDGPAASLLEAFGDGSAWWLYGRALLLYRREGDSEAARAALALATDYNPFAPPYLTGAKPMPRALPGYYGFGDENDALCMALTGKAAWAAAPGAVKWLAAAQAAGKRLH